MQLAQAAKEKMHAPVFSLAASAATAAITKSAGTNPIPQSDAWPGQHVFFKTNPISGLAQNSRLGHQLPTAILYQGLGPAISNTAIGFRHPLYDFRVRPRCTGKERDAETGLDFFGARYMSAAQGRWASPDLVNLTDERLLSPNSTANKYVYGGNNPLKYKDPDGRDITLFYEAGVPTGHAMLAAVNQQTNDFAFLSVGPATHLDSGIPLHPFSGVPGTSEFNLPQTADELRQGYSALTIQTTPEVAQQAIDAIRNGAGTGNYAIAGNQCSSACAQVLQDVGLMGPSNTFVPWTPHTLWNTLLRKYGKNLSRGDRYTLDYRPGTLMKANHGTDYGNARYGSNTFDFIMLLLKAPLKGCVTTPGLNGGKPETVCQ